MAYFPLYGLMVRNNTECSVSDLIRDVSFRWAGINKSRITISELTRIQNHLCNKYHVHSSTRASINRFASYSRYEIYFIRNGRVTRLITEPSQQCKEETERTELPYSPISDDETISCDSCGKKRPFPYIKYMNEWMVCGDKRCKAVANMFKRGRSKLPLISVIKEVCKYARKDNENKRRLAKYFVRHTRFISKQRNRPHSSENSSKTIRQLA